MTAEDAAAWTTSADIKPACAVCAHAGRVGLLFPCRYVRWMASAMWTLCYFVNFCQFWEQSERVLYEVLVSMFPFKLSDVFMYRMCR